MTIKYASLLAGTKFRTRLGRSLVTVVAASLVASIMLIATFVITGIRGSISGISQTPISRLNVAQERILNRVGGDRAKVVSNTPAPPPVAMTLDQYKASIASYHPQAVYEDVGLGSYTITDPALSQDNPSSVQTVSARSDALYNAALDTATPPVAQVNTLPAAVSSDVILALANITFSDTDTAAYEVSQTVNAENSWRGKVLTLTSADGNQTLKVTIQGFLPSGGLFGGGMGNTIEIPLSAAQGTLTNFPTSTEANTIFYASFSSQNDLLNFAQNEQSPRRTTGTFHLVSVYGNPLLQFTEIEGQIKNILKYIIIVLLVAVVLAMMTTLSKIIADSERETGVFRAIGAKVSDILQIYVAYSALVAVLAMILAIVIGSGVSEFLTNRYSNNLTYELITISGSTNLTSHVTLFGINWLDLGGVFLAILLAALIGALVPLVSLLRRDPIKALRSE